MPWPVYSHRFCRANVAGVWVRYIVPGGMIAVVRNWTVVMRGTAPADAYLEVGGNQVGYVNFQATGRLENHDYRHVAYAGEDVSLLTTVPLMYATVSGYLFTDTQNLTAAPGEVLHERALLPDAMPA